jgi:hypothetical protein
MLYIYRIFKKFSKCFLFHCLFHNSKKMCNSIIILSWQICKVLSSKGMYGQFTSNDEGPL